MFKISREIGNDQGTNIHCEIIIFRKPKHCGIKYLYDLAKKKQSEHVESKMNIISMNQSACNKPVILMFFSNSRGPEDKIAQDFLIVETHYRGDAGKYDDTNR